MMMMMMMMMMKKKSSEIVPRASNRIVNAVLIGARVVINSAKIGKTWANGFDQLLYRKCFECETNLGSLCPFEEADVWTFVLADASSR